VHRRSDRGRLLCSLFASAIIHIFTLAAVPWFAHRSFPRNVQAEDATIMVSSSPVRIERRTVRFARRMVSMRPQKASLSLPPLWAKQDYGNKAATDVEVWLDWTKQSANFVPRVMLWQMQAVEPYMRQPSLQDAVHDVLTSLRAGDAKVHTSKAQRVCGGERPGWFFSYLKPSGDPPLRVEETLFAVGETIYRATYVRPADQPEDTKAREALNTLC
jgi:hypothetical protein